ncbi:hypothetical protein NDU88_001516 [Pleurodeles waltl]|uniref:Uncharacterized protein n=1 Tax=Pleurodeles waltl TaxID=8319 RepID=A0AAV7PBD8_PLEWA|nr:hypothetical protein NDU88_001515 [Pleurodeles waltl]KAJ1123043.1 hypothetical protein NDU88_001516 [Pleurodeles waltl]
MPLMKHRQTLVDNTHFIEETVGNIVDVYDVKYFCFKVKKHDNDIIINDIGYGSTVNGNSPFEYDNFDDPDIDGPIN